MSLELRARAARARLALAEVFAYNPLQPRGPDGRWIKAGTGAPSVPDAPSAPGKKAAPGAKKAAKKTAPTASSGAAGWLEEAKRGKLSAASEKKLRESFAYSDPATGMRAEVSKVEATPTGRVQVSVDIKDASGLTVGKAMRNIETDKQTGQPRVYHTSFMLGKRAQGGGFSARWLRQMEDQYRDAGIKRIALTTTDVGGYAWAKAGFDFADRKEARVVASALTKLLNKRSVRDRLTQRQITDGQELIRRTLTPGAEYPTPAEFAMLGWMPGMGKDDLWVGKEAMLGTGWHGVKDL